MNPGRPFSEFGHFEPHDLALGDIAPKVGCEELALRCMDLTSLSGNDTPDRVRELAARARAHGVAALCVYPSMLPYAEGVRKATVAGAFPHGLSDLESRAFEVRKAAELADEIDVVIPRYLALAGDWSALYSDVSALREAAGERHLKVILATGELGDPVTIYRASVVALLAGADFIKTSTGKEAINATLEAGAPMCAALCDYFHLTGVAAGLKPAGGIRTADEAAQWVGLVEARLGENWLSPARFRIGASALLNDLLTRIA